MFGKMTVSEFYPMYKAFYIWSNEVSVVNLHSLLLVYNTALMFAHNRYRSAVYSKRWY